MAHPKYKTVKATEAATKKFEEEFSKSMGVRLSGGDKRSRPEIVTTGSLNLDAALGVGGIPRGRIVENWGPEAAGKTTLAMVQAGIYQRKFPDQRVAWVDMENTFDDDWATLLGVDVSRLYFYTPMTAEDVSDAVKRFVNSGMCSMVVLDSVGGMISRIEMEKEADEETVGKVPKIVTRMVKHASPVAAANGTTLYIINQVRANIGSYGPDEDTGGGWALKHVTTIKMQTRKSGGKGNVHTIQMDGKPNPVGHKIAVRVTKNKMAPYGRVAEIWLHNKATEKYGPVGLDPIAETFDFAKRLRLMGSGAGGNYEVEGVKIKGGEPKVMDYLRENPKVVEALRIKVIASMEADITLDQEDDPDSQGLGDFVKEKA